MIYNFVNFFVIFQVVLFNWTAKKKLKKEFQSSPFAYASGYVKCRGDLIAVGDVMFSVITLQYVKDEKGSRFERVTINNRILSMKTKNISNAFTDVFTSYET